MDLHPVLKVLHIPFTFAPDPVGGTEIYVEGLAQELRSCNIESIIAAPSCHGVDETYDYCGLRVRRYRSAPDSTRMLRELYGEGDCEAGLAFAQILDEEVPDIVHMHAFTRAVSIQLVRASKHRRIPVIFTYHTPTVSCQRGTLMLWGTKVCDGVVNTRRCTDCSLANEGLPRWASMPLSYVPPFVAKTLENAELSGGLWTALRMGDLIRTRCNAFEALVSEVDGIIALKEWVRTLDSKWGSDVEDHCISARFGHRRGQVRPRRRRRTSAVACRIFWKVRLRQRRRHVDKGSQSGAGIKNRAPPVRSDPEWRGSRISYETRILGCERPADKLSCARSS